MDNQELHSNGGITAYFCGVNVVDSRRRRRQLKPKVFFFTDTAPVIVFSHVIWVVFSKHSVPLFFNPVNGPTSILTELYLFKMKSPQAQNGHLKITRALLTAWTQTPNWEYSVVRGKIIGLVRETGVNCRMGGGDNVAEWSARRTRNPAIPGSIESASGRVPS